MEGSFLLHPWHVWKRNAYDTEPKNKTGVHKNSPGGKKMQYEERYFETNGEMKKIAIPKQGRSRRTGAIRAGMPANDKRTHQFHRQRLIHRRLDVFGRGISRV